MATASRTMKRNDEPRLSVNRLKQNLLNQTKDGQKVAVQQKSSRPSGNVTNRLQPDQMNVLKNSLGKKPKNKYRRADTSPGLFNQNIAIAQNNELDEIFEPLSKNFDSSKSQMNLTSQNH